MNNFGKRLKSLLSENEISIKEFAKRVGLSEIGLHNAIKSNSTKLETLERIAVALNVPVSFFIKTEEELLIEVQAKEKENLLRALNEEYINKDRIQYSEMCEWHERANDYQELIFTAIANGVPLESFLIRPKSTKKGMTGDKEMELWRKLINEFKQLEFIKDEQGLNKFQKNQKSK